MCTNLSIAAATLAAAEFKSHNNSQQLEQLFIHWYKKLPKLESTARSHTEQNIQASKEPEPDYESHDDSSFAQGGS